MANDMLIKTLLVLSVISLALSTREQIVCFKNSTLLETTGDTILNVFVDANYGQYCNITSADGFQQILTALHVVRTLNKYDYVPDVKLGLRIFDTCHNKVTIFRQILQVASEYNCDYELGLVVSSRYNSVVDPFRNYGDLPINTYEKQTFVEPAIEILVHYLSTRYEVVDLVLANANSVRDRFMEFTRNAGVCVKRHDDEYFTDNRDANVTMLIVMIGERNDIQRWLNESGKSTISEETLILLPLGDSNIDDLIPSGSYVIKPETPDFEKFTNVDEFLKNFEDSAYHSPYLLSIGKAVIGLAEVLSSVRDRNCSADNCDDDQSCVATQFLRSESTREIRESDVYETLRAQPKSYSIRYVVAMKTTQQHDLVDVAFYGIEMFELRVFSEKMVSRMPRLCLENLVGNCENCTNFQDERVVTEGDMVSKSVLKSSVYVPVFLLAIVCGTLVCCVILIFVIYRFVTEDMLDGNPTLTIVLVLTNMFTLLTALPFCMTDDYFDAESINAQKILLTTLAFGLTFSIVLSRALFMALSTSGVLVAHINGYLLGLMVFFMSGVQIVISIMYFILNTANSALIVRSSTFIALLGYDMFLLIALFIASCFVTKIQRNYNEGKCFLGTAGGLLVLWTTWLICFVSMEPENRDVIVSFGIIGTGYLIIFGIFVPRIYYMITLLPARKNRESNITANSPANSIVNTIVRQSRTSHVCPTRDNQILQMSPAYPNYYGSPNLKSKPVVRCRNSNQHETPDYGFQPEMKEINARDYDIPQIFIEEAESSRNVKIAPNDVVYAQPRIYTSQRIVLVENKNTENIRQRDDSSPTSTSQRMYPMRYASPANVVREQRIDEVDEDEDEEDDEDGEDHEIESVVKVTRL